MYYRCLCPPLRLNLYPMSINIDTDKAALEEGASEQKLVTWCYVECLRRRLVILYVMHDMHGVQDPRISTHEGGALPSLLTNYQPLAVTRDLGATSVSFSYSTSIRGPPAPPPSITVKFAQNGKGENTHVLACANWIPLFVFRASILVLALVSSLFLRLRPPRHRRRLLILHCSGYHPLHPANVVNTGCVTKTCRRDHAP